MVSWWRFAPWAVAEEDPGERLPVVGEWHREERDWEDAKGNSPQWCYPPRTAIASSFVRDDGLAPQ